MNVITTKQVSVANKDSNNAKHGKPTAAAATKTILPTPTKPTLGEELFLVHLNRNAGKPVSEQDFDTVMSSQSPTSRKRSRSVGEELWEVHVRRSQGLEPDYDTEEASTKAVARPTTSKTTTTKKKKNNNNNKLDSNFKKVMHLRNRDVTVSE